MRTSLHRSFERLNVYSFVVTNIGKKSGKLHLQLTWPSASKPAQKKDTQKKPRPLSCSQHPSMDLDSPSPLAFHPTLLTPSNTSSLQKAYKESKPYHHAVVSELFEPEFLRKAREELVENVAFREKETDICELWFRGFGDIAGMR